MISMTEKGLYCEAGGFHIDPLRRVELALITHAHSDHARAGSRRYICVASGAALLRRRIGGNADIRTVAYGEVLRLGRARVSFHPAGHILGSAQIRVERDGEVWVASGDYKRHFDPTCEPFEVVGCDTFITEATFGQPSYQWDDPAEIIRRIHEWWQGNARAGLNSLLYCYALGKSQHVLAGLLRHTEEPVFVHGETAELTELYRREGVRMVPTLELTESSAGRHGLRGRLVVAPHSIDRSPWIERLGPLETAFASGWMREKGGAFGIRGRYGHGFPLSDHSDWPSLIRTIEQTGARRVLVLHGKEGGALIRHLRKKGVDAALFTPDSLKKGLPSFQMELFKS